MQFIASFWPESEFASAPPDRSAFNLGQAFARHFGMTNGTGDVVAFEVGNEPWHYTDGLYADVFLGMARGSKAGDARMRLLPGAFNGLPMLSRRMNASHLRYVAASPCSIVASRPTFACLTLRCYIVQVH